MSKKRDSDPLVYVDAINTFFKQGVQTTLTTEVYGKIHKTEVIPMLVDNPRLELTYAPTEDCERTQSVRLTQTPCYFGGFRWWLLCPACSHRVRKLFLIEQYRCRHCHNLTYRSRKRNRHSTLYAAQKELDRAERIEKLLEHMISTKYAGRPTKRFLEVARLLDKNT